MGTVYSSFKTILAAANVNKIKDVIALKNGRNFISFQSNVIVEETMFQMKDRKFS